MPYFVNLAERGDGLVEAQAERGEVVNRGLRHSSPRPNGDDSEAAREVPLPRVVGGGWRDPGEDGRVWARGVGEPELVLSEQSKICVLFMNTTKRVIFGQNLRICFLCGAVARAVPETKLKMI